MARVAQGAAATDETLTNAQALMGRGEYRQALSLLEPLAHTRSLTTLQHARLYQQLAAARSQVGSEEQALADADTAERDARAIDAFDLLARIESVRGVVWLNRGRSVDSLRHFKDCLAWAQRSAKPALIAGAYIRIAAAYQDAGDWTRALDAVNHSYEADPHPDAATRAQYLTRRGLVEMELHEGALAKASIEEALRLTRQSGDKRSEAQILIDLALLCQRIDRDVPRAIAAATQAVAIARDIRMTSIEIPALNELGSLLRDAARPAEARDRLLDALAVIEHANERRDEPYVLKNLAQVLIALGRTEEGERRLEQAVARADAANLTRVRWLARLELAGLHAVADPSRADREFAETLAIVDQQQANVLLEGFRAGALDQTLAEHDPYDRYVSFLIDRGQPERAFAIAERQRARAFLETLSTAREALAAGVPAGFTDAENALLRRISTEQAELRRADASGSRRAEVLRVVDLDEQQLTALRLRLATERPALAQARYPRIWSVRDLQSRLLAQDELLLSFFLGADRSICWIVGTGRFDTVALPGQRDLERLVQAALAQLRDPQAADDRALEPLGRALGIDRLARTPPGTRLVVIPHGILYDLPFEALAGADGRRLVELFPVSYVPSASSLAFLRSLDAVRGASTSLLAVGNPRGTTPLPHSADEIRRIAALFQPRVRILESARATERGVREAASHGVRMLHFATHGLVDESRPDRSGLVLTASPPDDDGLLQMREIYGLAMQADLVTLSACQTALGRNVTGEGMIGLTRAFFYAGARAVVASLWDIEDASTAQLMERFYSGLHDGQPIDVALQQAKVAAIRGGGASSRPFYWASFVASGRTRTPIDVPPLTWAERLSMSVAARVAGGVALVLAMGGLVWRQRSRRRPISAPAP